MEKLTNNLADSNINSSYGTVIGLILFTIFNTKLNLGFIIYMSFELFIGFPLVQHVFKGKYSEPKTIVFMFVRGYLVSIPLICYLLQSVDALLLLFMVMLISSSAYFPNQKSNFMNHLFFMTLHSYIGAIMILYLKVSWVKTLNMLFFTYWVVFYIIYLKENVTTVTKRLDKNLESYEQIFVHVESTIMKLNKKLDIIFINKDFFDLKKEELIGKNIKELFNDKEFEEKLKDMKKLPYTEVKRVFDEKIHYFCCSGTKIEEENEILLVLDDISYKKNVEEKEKSRIKAVSSLKAKTEFIAQISHEIRNPLQVINYCSEILASSNLGDELQKITSDIVRSSKLLKVIIGDILDMSKIEVGKMELTIQKSNLEEAIHDAIHMNSVTAYSKGLRIYHYFDFNLPKYFEGDVSRLIQVMNNLISNAVKYTKKGYISIYSKMIKKDDEVKFRFECKDTGIGISKEGIDKLFTPFEQIHQNKLSPTNFKGWGLGLSICKALFNLMNAQYGVESEIGIGSTFWFEIPLKSPSTDNINTGMQLSIQKAIILFPHKEYSNYLIGLAKSFGIQKAFNDLNESIMKDFDYQRDLLIFDESMSPLVEKYVKSSVKFGFVISEQKHKKYVNMSPPLYIVELINTCLGRLSERKKSSTPEVLQHFKILAVDDNPMILKSISHLLKKLNFSQVGTAKNGVEAIELIEKEDYHIVLMDIQMPTMNGIEATKIIREMKDESKSKVTIIALTGNAIEKSKEDQCKIWRVDDILMKPVNKQEILESIGRNLMKFDEDN